MGREFHLAFGRMQSMQLWQLRAIGDLDAVQSSHMNALPGGGGPAVFEVMPKSDADIEVAFVRSFRVCGACLEWRRIGEAGDGGYLTCFDNLAGNVVAAISLGVEQHDQWSDDIHAALRIPVHQFDCFIDKPPGAEHTWHKKCVLSPKDSKWHKQTDDTRISLAGAVELSYPNAPNQSLVLKMDVEGSEKCVLSEASPDLLRKFRQIILEVHRWQHPGCKKELLKGVQQLLRAGFVVTHLHGNNYRPLVTLKSGISLPDTFEVTLVAAETLSVQRPACLEMQDVHPLDWQNKQHDNNRNPVDEMPPAQPR